MLPVPPQYNYAIYGAVCIQITHFSYDENICTWSHYHYQIGGKYDPFVISRDRSWNTGMNSMSFHIPFDDNIFIITVS